MAQPPPPVLGEVEDTIEEYKAEITEFETRMERVVTAPVPVFLPVSCWFLCIRRLTPAVADMCRTRTRQNYGTKQSAMDEKDVNPNPHDSRLSLSTCKPLDHPENTKSEQYDRIASLPSRPDPQRELAHSAVAKAEVSSPRPTHTHMHDMTGWVCNDCNSPGRHQGRGGVG